MLKGYLLSHRPVTRYTCVFFHMINKPIITDRAKKTPLRKSEMMDQVSVSSPSKEPVLLPISAP